jgi:hypothetical protein
LAKSISNWPAATAGAVKVQQQGAMEWLAGRDAGGGQLALAVGCELVGDDGATNGGEHVARVPFAVFMEAGHTFLTVVSLSRYCRSRPNLCRYPRFLIRCLAA